MARPLTGLVLFERVRDHEEPCRRSDHALDAVVAALTAQAAVQDQVCRPAERELPAARTEGWIAIPTAPLAALPG